MNLATKSAGEKTRELILQTALRLFRGCGFEITTMRDIARAAEVATGAAYYYFPSKEAIVFAYYDQVQRAHTETVREEWKGESGLRERLDVVLDLLTQAIELSDSALVRPFVQPFQNRVLQMLQEAGWTAEL